MNMSKISAILNVIAAIAASAIAALGANGLVSAEHLALATAGVAALNAIAHAIAPAPAAK